MFSVSTAITDELMLHESLLHGTSSPPTEGAASLPSAGRSIEQILARQQARMRRRKHVFPPDFLHGQARLDEIYTVFGEAWVEEALFVEKFFDDDGELVAYTAAWFDERFLTLEQVVRDEVDDLEGQLGRLEEAHKSVVYLCIDATTDADEVRLAVRCSLGRLLELERQRLAVVRDKEFSDPRAIYSQRDDVLQDSRTSMLSLVCLCARLGRRVQ